MPWDRLVRTFRPHDGNFPATIEAVLDCGGDTDTVGAIAGSLAGATCGASGIPAAGAAALTTRGFIATHTRLTAMASGLRAELPAGGFLGQCEVSLEDLLFRDAQTADHSG